MGRRIEFHNVLYRLELLQSKCTDSSSSVIAVFDSPGGR